MDILVHLIKIVAIVFGFVMLMGSLLTLVERKQSAILQNRVGPNRANIGRFRLGGILHIAADAVKMILKEDIVPRQADGRLHFIAPFLGLFPYMVMWAVVPFGNQWCPDGPYDPELLQQGILQCSEAATNYFQIADLDAGLLFVFAITSLSVYGSALAGWASNSKFSLLGGLRTTAQMISYEVSMLLSLAGIIMVYGTIDLNEMVVQQGHLIGGVVPMWGILVQPLAFFLFLAAGIAETKRAPFDLPEAESELVAGYFTEFSSMKFAVFSLGEFVGVAVMGALLTTMFLGGWQVPFLESRAVGEVVTHGFYFGDTLLAAIPYWLMSIMQVASFIVKVLFLCWFQLMIRWTLPRFRYDNVMDLGWKILLPLSLANLLVTGFVMLLI